jgi:phosphohistidine phosphatase
MKTLYLVRHAKSSWKHDVDDHKRPLKTRGENDGILVSRKAKSEIVPPQKIITSDATRALSTAQFFKDALGVSDDNFESNHDLYDFRGQNVMRVIKALDDSLDKVMIVGHNHAFTSLVNMMGNKYIENIPTCGFVMLEFDENSWKDITTGKTVMTIFPRDLKP